MKWANRIACGLASAFIAGASFATFPVSAAELETRTLTYAETAALFGYTKFQAVEEAGIDVSSYVYTTDLQYTKTHNPSGWWTNYNVDGVPYIGIRIYGFASEWAQSKIDGRIQVQARTGITLTQLNDFTFGAGYVGNAYIGDRGYSNLVLYYYENGVRNHFSGNAQMFQKNAVNVDTLSVSQVYVTQDAVYSPALATSPIYSFYTVASGNEAYNFNLDVYGLTYLNRPETVDGIDYTAYTYILLRCPTITAPPDALADITGQLGGISDTLQGILDSFTPDTDPAPAVSSVATQASADASAVSSALGEEHDFLHSFQYSGFPEGYDPTYSDDAVGLFAILFRFWENNQYAITVSAGAMALALVSYILYGRKF